MPEKEYIEREAIINKIVNTPTVPSRQCYEGNFVYADGVSGRQNEIINYINEQPTADVAPVKHGFWEEIRDAYGQLEGWICKECGRETKSKENYCPNCGARMEEGKNGRNSENRN